MALTSKQVEWAKQHNWFRSAVNHREYCQGEWWSVEVYDSELDAEVTFDRFKSLEEWANKSK